MEQLIIKDVAQTLKNKELFSNANLILTSGKIYGLIGENGSGKTILLKTILGLIPCSKGMIMFDNSVLGKDMEFPNNAGFLIENPSSKYMLSTIFLNVLPLIVILEKNTP